MINNRTLPLLFLLHLVTGATLPDENIFSRALRWLEEDAHAHDDLATTLKWSGIFRFVPGTDYKLTVKIPAEDSDPHAGHNHRHLTSRRLEDEDHSDHDHAEDDHSGHDEEGHLLLALVPVSATGQEGIDEAFEVLNSMEGAVLSVEDGASVTASSSHAYELVFHDVESTATVSLINIITTENYVLFLPATPSQVSGEEHFLVDDEGAQIWPQTARFYTPPDPRDGDKPWGTVIGATLLINLVTLIGVIFLVPMLSTAFRNRTMGEAWKELTSSPDIQLIGGRTQKLFDMAITSFACGALLATTVFLIVPEAIVLVNSEPEAEDAHAGHDHRMLQGDDDHSDHGHGNKNWVFGTSVLAGFLFPMFLASFFPHHHLDDAPSHSNALNTTDHQTAEMAVETEHFKTTGHPSSDASDVVEAKEDAESGGDAAASAPIVNNGGSTKKKQANKRLVVGILLGDSLHNFADGVFVGAAFLLCGETFGWTVLAGTIYHELAQEVSDFFILTTHAHLPPVKALVLNFVSGLSVTLGGIIVLGTDVSDYALGIILSMSAGVYINVAAKECMPTVERLAVTTGDRIIAFLAFSCGAIPIGLVLLNHQHC